MLVFNAGSGNLAAVLGVPPFVTKEYQQAAQSYGYGGVEQILLLLHEYNLRSIGIGDSGTSDSDLLKELAVKMVQTRAA